jgi:uncharacterized membrane protein YoaK (UPF0700 family)
MIESDKMFDIIKYISLAVLFFIVGIFIGEISAAVHDPSRIAMLAAGISTVLSIVLGVKVFAATLRRRYYLVSSTVFMIWAANLSFSLGMFSASVIDILYNVATILMMIVIYKTYSLDQDKLKEN